MFYQNTFMFDTLVGGDFHIDLENCDHDLLWKQGSKNRWVCTLS